MERAFASSRKTSRNAGDMAAPGTRDERSGDIRPPATTAATASQVRGQGYAVDELVEMIHDVT